MERVGFEHCQIALTSWPLQSSRLYRSKMVLPRRRARRIGWEAHVGVGADAGLEDQQRFIFLAVTQLVRKYT